MTTLALLWLVLVYAHGLYSGTGWWLWINKTFSRIPPHGWPHEVWRWTKWPALGNVVLSLYFTITGVLGFQDGISATILAGTWWVFRNAGDDDLQRKFRRKLSETVQRVGGRLVIVAKVAKLT